MKKKINILITGAGSPGGPGIIESLIKESNLNVFICDCNNEASGKYLLPEKFFLVPKADDDNFIKFITDICNQNKISIIFPLVTKELFKFSEFKEKFLKNNIKIIVADKHSLNIVNDKGLLYEYLKNKGVKVPKFFLVENEEDLINKVFELGYPEIPVVIKPRVSNGSRGVKILDENQDRLKLFFDEKPNSIYTNLSEMKYIIKGKKIPKLVLSEFLPGEEITIDTLILKNKLQDIFIRTRDIMRSGISIKGKFIEDENIFRYIESIIDNIPGLEGPIGFQLKKSSKDEFLLLECNPRIQGTSISALGLGYNIPLMAVNNILGIPNSNYRKKSGVSFCRYYKEIFYES